MNGTDTGTLPLDNIAHIIQIALTPVFLLSAIGTLLNVLNMRVTKVGDMLTESAEREPAPTSSGAKEHVDRLLVRLMILNIAVGSMAVSGVSICIAAFLLFWGGLRESESATAETVLFGVSLLATAAAIFAFLLDSLMSWKGLHRRLPDR